MYTWLSAIWREPLVVAVERHEVVGQALALSRGRTPRRSSPAPRPARGNFVRSCLTELPVLVVEHLLRHRDLVRLQRGEVTLLRGRGRTPGRARSGRDASRNCPEPSTSNAPNRSGLATATPGTLAMRSAIAGLKLEPGPASPTTTRSPRNAWSIWPLIDSFSELAKIVIRPTSATPIMSAAAVDAVRRGLRTAFSRASRPGMPRQRGSGAPMARPTGRAITGPSTATPMNRANTPRPTSWIPPSPNSPTGARPRRAPRSRRRSRCAGRGAATPPRSRAAPPSGRSRAARRAGSRAATNVTITPSAIEITNVDGLITRSDVGTSKPNAPITARSPIARPRPTPTPTIDATNPTRNASPSTDVPHLAARRAERAEQRELARPLGDDDRERVDDDERADEQGDDREDQQERGEEPEALLDLVLLLLDQLGAGDDLDPALVDRRSGSDRRARPGSTPGLAATEMPSSWPGVPLSALRLGAA